MSYLHLTILSNMHNNSESQTFDRDHIWAKPSCTKLEQKLCQHLGRNLAQAGLQKTSLKRHTWHFPQKVPNKTTSQNFAHSTWRKFSIYILFQGQKNFPPYGRNLYQKTWPKSSKTSFQTNEEPKYTQRSKTNQKRSTKILREEISSKRPKFAPEAS